VTDTGCLTFHHGDWDILQRAPTCPGLEEQITWWKALLLEGAAEVFEEDFREVETPVHLEALTPSSVNSRLRMLFNVFRNSHMQPCECASGRDAHA